MSVVCNLVLVKSASVYAAQQHCHHCLRAKQCRDHPGREAWANRSTLLRLYSATPQQLDVCIRSIVKLSVFPETSDHADRLPGNVYMSG